MVGLGVGQGGVVIGTLCGDTTGEAVCGAGGSRTSERQRTRGLRTGEEFGNTGISDVSGSTVMTSGVDSSATGDGPIGTSLDVDGVTRGGRTEVKICMFICVTKGVVEIMPRKLFLRKANVIPSCLDNSIAMTNPHVCKTFVPKDNPWT